MFNIKGNYYGMDRILSRAWQLVEKPTMISNVCNELLKEYDVSREKCEKDVLGIFQELSDEDLIKVIEV